MSGRITWEPLKAAIASSGMTAVDFAHSVGVSALSIGLVKAGKPIPPTSEKKLLKAVYGDDYKEVSV